MLRKISKNILIAIVFVMFMPLLAKADIGAPEIMSYEVVVTNKEGAVIYDWNFKKIGTVPVDQVLEITMEEYKGDTLYGYVSYDKKFGYVKISDTTMYKEEINPKDMEDYNENAKVRKKYVFDDDVKLYKGPSFAYKLVFDEDIKIGTILEYNYSVGDWMYTKYNGKSGWVYTYPYSSEGANFSSAHVATVSSGLVFTISDTVIYKDAYAKEKTDMVIPKGKEVSYKYLFSPYAKATSYYINYEGTEGWIHTKMDSYPGDDNTIFLQKMYNDIYLVEEKEYPVYESYDAKKKIATIKGNQIVKAGYIYSAIDDNYDSTDYYRVEYENGKYGWVNLEYNQYAPDNKALYKANKDIVMYSNPDNSKKTDMVIAKDTEFKTLFSFYKGSNSWYYIILNDIKGWIMYTNDNMTLIEDLNDETEEITPVDDKKEEENKEDDKSTSGMSNAKKITIAVVASVVVALTVIVTIVLVNKKKVKTNA